MEFLQVKSPIDPPPARQQEVLSGKSMGKLINHYCKPTAICHAAVYYFIYLQEQANRDEGLNRQK